MSAALEASEAKSLAAFRSTLDGLKPGDDDAIFERLRESHPSTMWRSGLGSNVEC